MTVDAAIQHPYFAQHRQRPYEAVVSSEFNNEFEGLKLDTAGWYAKCCEEISGERVHAAAPAPTATVAQAQAQAAADRNPIDANAGRPPKRALSTPVAASSSPAAADSAGVLLCREASPAKRTKTGS